MAETEVQAETEHNPPRFELEQTDDYSKYLLYSKSEILAVLRTLIQKGAMITAHFDRGNSFLLTSMISLSADNQQFILDVGSNEEMNQKALLAKKLILTTVIDKVKIQFSLTGLAPSQYDGHPAFIATLPETLLRLQRREFFRLSTPIASPIRLTTTVTQADNSTLFMELPLLDISGGGIGLMLTLDQAQLFERGDLLNECKMLLPDEGLLVATLCVRNMFDVATRSGSRYVRVGCEFINVPPARLTMVQRYITRIERERKARLSGMG